MYKRVTQISPYCVKSSNVSDTHTVHCTAIYVLGYCKEKVKKKEVGVTLIDMFLLSPDKHDKTGVKWQWQTVKQVRQQSARVLYELKKNILGGGVKYIMDLDL